VWGGVRKWEEGKLGDLGGGRTKDHFWEMPIQKKKVSRLPEKGKTVFSLWGGIVPEKRCLFEKGIRGKETKSVKAFKGWLEACGTLLCLVSREVGGKNPLYSESGGQKKGEVGGTYLKEGVPHIVMHSRREGGGPNAAKRRSGSKGALTKPNRGGKREMTGKKKGERFNFFKRDPRNFGGDLKIHLRTEGYRVGGGGGKKTDVLLKNKKRGFPGGRLLWAGCPEKRGD